MLDKAQRESKVRNVQLYAYSEPSTHPDLHQFVQECTDRQIPAIISTIGQYSRCDWRKVVDARPREIRISFPGWKHMAYYQRGATPERFNANFDKLMLLPRHKETTWTLGFHIYKDTAEEMPAAIELARRYRLKFVPLQAIHMDNGKHVSQNWTEADRELLSHLVESREDQVKRFIYSDFCYCQSKQITISADGRVWLCQLTYDFPLGDFLDMSLKEIRKTIKEHPFCVLCKNVKGNVYQELYGYFFDEGSPVAKAEKGRRE